MHAGGSGSGGQHSASFLRIAYLHQHNRALADQRGAVADIPIQKLKRMFANMRSEAGWNTADKLLWGYFFIDPKPKRLAPLADHLVTLGYRLVSLHQTDDRSTHVLHVERVEIHTPASLFERNAELNALASEFGVESYDGMDVGPASHT